MELPQDFTERMKGQLNDGYADFLAEYAKERVYGLRCNPLKIDKEKLQSALFKAQIILDKVPWAEEGFYYSADAHPGKLPLHEAGAYYIQEPSAMIAARLLDPKPGENILDLCAAPGGKSTQIAGRMQGKGLLVSNEMIPQRAKTLSRNIERMGVRNAVVCNETPQHLAERFPLFFDKIMVDAPCSGEGMFRKDIQSRQEWSLKQVEVCAKRQQDILAQAAVMLKPGGVLVYSTCTFAPQENEQNAAWFVQQYPQFTLQKSEQIWPHLQRGEGHYAAKFIKKGTSVKEMNVTELSRKTTDTMKKMAAAERGKTTATTAYKKQIQTFCDYFTEFCEDVLTNEVQVWMFRQIEQGRLTVFGDQFYLLPSGMNSLDGLKTERAGLQLGCCKKNRFEPSHALAMALRPKEAKRILELEEPERYLRGETICCENQKGWTLVTVEGCSIGWGKAANGILKNHYPKGLRK